MLARKFQPGGLIEIELVTDGAQWRQRGKSLPETLHAPALVIDGDQQPRTSQTVDLRHEVLQLPRIGVVAGEQDDAAHQRMSQQFTIFRAQRSAGDVDHQWAQGHGMSSPGLSADAPGGASKARDSTWVVCGNMSATPAASSSNPSSWTRI